MVVRETDFRQILHKELTHRCEQNPRYSLRAFARDLNISASRLSEILNQKQGLSSGAALKIAKILGFDDRESQHFCDLVSAKHARSPKEREEAKLRLLKQDFEKERDERFHLQLDAFKIISDWYHLGILELMKCKGFRHESKWISRRLGVPLIQIELALDRLVRVGLLQKLNGEFVATQKDGWVPGGIPSADIRKFHRQVLEKALQAMSMQAIQERMFTTRFLTLDRKDLPAAFSLIQEFQDRFCEQFQSEEPKDRLYCMSMQLFKIMEEETV